MVQLKQILCPVDLSDLSIRAIAYANALAKWYQSSVTVLHIVPTFDAMEVRAGALFDEVRVVYPMPRDQVLEQVGQAVDTAGGAAGDTQLAVEAGDPAAVIVDQALARRSDVLVMATHGRSGFDRLLLGSVTEKVLHRAPCPVLTVPPHASEAAAHVAVRSILCPMDFSPAALQALGFAADLARRVDASLTVLHVIEWLTEEEPRQLAPFDVAEFRTQLLKDARARLEALLAEQPRIERGAHVSIGGGRPYREILRVAAEGPTDLIVMGAQGRGGAALATLGSTTQHVVRAASCPVLAVRAPLLDAR